MVDPAVRLHRGGDPERNAEQDRDEHRVERQLEGRREAGGQVGEDGLARRERGAEVAVEQVLDVGDVLLEDGLVEPVLMDQRLPLLRARERAYELVDRVPGDDARQREGDERDPEQDGHEEEKPARRVGQHRWVTTEMSGRCGPPAAPPHQPLYVARVFRNM